MSGSREAAFEQMSRSLDLMVKAGWVQSYTAESPDTGYDIKWTPKGMEVLGTAWGLMEELGGNGRGTDQGTWGALGYLAIVRFRDPDAGPQFGN
jgi:hypothetical protein